MREEKGKSKGSERIGYGHVTARLSGRGQIIHEHTHAAKDIVRRRERWARDIDKRGGAKNVFIGDGGVRKRRLR